METNSRVRFLRIALALVGLIFIFGVYPLMMAWWPSGWRWQPNQPEYEQMILGVYATLGVFLLLAARNPLNNLSLIWFTVWSQPCPRRNHGNSSDENAVRAWPLVWGCSCLGCRSICLRFSLRVGPQPVSEAQLPESKISCILQLERFGSNLAAVKTNSFWRPPSETPREVSWVQPQGIGKFVATDTPVLNGESQVHVFHYRLPPGVTQLLGPRCAAQLDAPPNASMGVPGSWSTAWGATAAAKKATYKYYIIFALSSPLPFCEI